MNKINDIAKVTAQTIERLTLEFPSNDRKFMLDWISQHGYTLGRSGPKQIDVGRVDPDIQLWVVEREIG